MWGRHAAPTPWNGARPAMRLPITDYTHRQPVPSRVQRISLEAAVPLKPWRQRIYFNDAPIGARGPSRMPVKRPVLCPGTRRGRREAGPRVVARRVGVTRMPAGTRRFAWTVEFGRGGVVPRGSEMTDAPTYETAAPVARRRSNRRLGEVVRGEAAVDRGVISYSGQACTS